jgi:DNA polymerase III subunit beta
MNIKINRTHFLDKVDLLKQITKAADKMMPVTRNVLIELAGNKGKISATNLSISAITDIKCEYEGEPVKIMVAGGTLEEVLVNLKAQDVEIDYPDAPASGSAISGNMVISQGRVEIGIAIGDPDEFPQVELLTEVETITLPASDILRGIKKVFYAVSSDETRYVLTGMLMMVKDGKLIVCGTDGFRMALWKKDLKDEADTPQIVIPARNVKIIKDTISENSNVGIIITQDKVQMMTEAVTIITRTISGAFPDYEAVHSGVGWENIAFVKRVEMLECLNRISAVRNSNDPVSLHRIGNDGMQIDVKSEKGYCREIIDAKYKSDAALDFAFNGKFLIDALEHLEGEEVLLRYPTTYGAVIFDESDYICVVMPIRDAASPIEEAAKRKVQSSRFKVQGSEAEEQKQQQGGAEDARRVHTPEDAGSTPAPATNEDGGKMEEGSGKTKKHYKVKKHD